MDDHLEFDGRDDWENIDLAPDKMKAFYLDLLTRFPILPFPQQRDPGYRFFSNNNWFALADAFTLSGIIRKQMPHHIIEVGSGFSSAVMLDTLEHTQHVAKLTFVEPFPERLHTLLSPTDRANSTLVAKRVQEVPISLFDELENGDVLFIDSSHVAKAGSDVSFLFLRVLPHLRPGVIVQFHDIFYPFSYPIRWIREGRAWNESLFLRCFLLLNREFRVIAFNSFAGATFPEIFRESFPGFLENTGGSIWLQRV